MSKKLPKFLLDQLAAAGWNQVGVNDFERGTAGLNIHPLITNKRQFSVEIRSMSVVRSRLMSTDALSELIRNL